MSQVNYIYNIYNIYDSIVVIGDKIIIGSKLNSLYIKSLYQILLFGETELSTTKIHGLLFFLRC